MGLRSNYGTDRALENDGVQIPVDTNDHNGKPIVISISRMGRTNKRYTKALEEATRPHQASIANETLDNELGSQILREVFVDTVLLGWSNLPKSELTGVATDTDELPYSRENALALFDALPDFYDVCEGHAKKASNFRAEQKKVAGKN